MFYKHVLLNRKTNHVRTNKKKQHRNNKLQEMVDELPKNEMGQGKGRCETMTNLITNIVIS